MKGKWEVIALFVVILAMAVALHGCATTPTALDIIKDEQRTKLASELEDQCIAENFYPKGRPIGLVVYNANMQHPLTYCRHRARAVARGLVR